MPVSQRTATTARRTILRFDLSSISIDGRPNAYKKPQLVLKPQLDLPPRRPFTGSKPRMPVWRHFLMVHVKDKAAELVKLDLASFKQVESSGETDATQYHTVSCLFSSCSLVFRYPSATRKETSSLCVTFPKTSDIDTVLQELNALGIIIQDEQANQDHHCFLSEYSAPEHWKPLEQAAFQIPWPPSSSMLLNGSCSALAAPPSSQGHHLPYPESQTHRTILQRPPSQPLGQPPGLPAVHRPWSPAFVPSRPATTLGVPGILGEGIYKVSKIGSAFSSRQRVRRTATMLDPQGPKFYTASKHFDRTLNLLPSRAPDVRRVSSTPRPNLPSYLTPPPSVNSGDQAMRPPSRTSSALGGLPVNIQYRVPLQRLRTGDRASERTLTPGPEEKENQFCLSSVAEEELGFYSQTEMTSRSPGMTDYDFLLSSGQTLVEPPAKQEMDDDWLMGVSQIQHQGLCEASRVWDEFMGKGAAEVASVEDAKDLSDALSKFEGNFTKRWEEAVAATARKMSEVRLRGLTS
ncbi:hypothetical protein VTI74DRAFT_2310 [Chaetomium olivicolor]